MPIWSLTEERLAKLKEAIAKKRKEHDELEAKSEKDLWCADLDDFMAEWNAQIALEEELQTKIRRMGRRVSKKIGAGRGRKGKDDDDYEPDKKPRGKGKAAAAKAAVKPKVETKSAQRFIEMLSSETKKEPKDDVMDLSDNFSDDDFAALSRNKPATSKVTELSQSQSASQSLSEEPEVVRPTKRAAASKAKTLFEVSSDSEAEDMEMIGDIGSMVKGIGKPAGDTSGRLSLYAMNRPESSQGNSGSSGLQKLKTKPSKSSMDIDSHDETNYELLAKSSPHKIKDEEDDAGGQDSDDELGAGPAPSNTDSGLVAVKKARAKPTVSKAKAKPEPKAKAKAAAAPKQTTLSPAAKAYAARKKVIGVKKIALEGSDDEMADPPSPVSKPKLAARGRPGRAAAAKRPVIVDEDSSLMQDESDDPFEMDDD